MRKTGIYIALGITISLSIFILAGVLYFRPEISGESVELKPPVAVVTEAPPVPAAPAPAKPAEPVPAPVPSEPVVAAEDIAEPVEIVAAEPIGQPVVDVQAPVPAPVEPPMPPVPSAPMVRMTVSAYEAPQPAEPEVTAEPQEAVEAELAVAEPEVPVVEEPQKRVIEPEKHDRPVLRVPEAPRLPSDIRSILPFVRPEPVTYLWTPVEIPEGPTQHVDPVSFSKEAFERRKNAVDEVLEKLVWE